MPYSLWFLINCRTIGQRLKAGGDDSNNSLPTPNRCHKFNLNSHSVIFIYMREKKRVSEFSG